MRNIALFALVFTACTDEPDLLDQILRDTDPVMPEYRSGKADGLTVDQLVSIHCPGVTYSGATTYRGITGTFQHVGIASLGEPWRIQFVADRDDTDAAGTFAGTRIALGGFPVPYAGRFAALPDNPAIGAVLALDIGGDGEYDETYFVLGTRRSFGRVASLCLAGAERPFLLTRSLF